VNFGAEIPSRSIFPSFPQKRVAIQKMRLLNAINCDRAKCRYCRKYLLIVNLKMSHEMSQCRNCSKRL